MECREIWGKIRPAGEGCCCCWMMFTAGTMLLLLQHKRRLRLWNSIDRKKKHQTLLLKLLVEGNEPENWGNSAHMGWVEWSSPECPNSVNVAPGDRG